MSRLGFLCLVIPSLAFASCLPAAPAWEEHPVMTQRDAVSSLVPKGAVIQVNAQFSVSHVTLGSRIGSAAGDEDLVLMQAFPALKSLVLIGPTFTDAGLSQLKSARKLTLLTLTNTAVTGHGIEAFKQVVPSCRVISSSGVARQRGRGATSNGFPSLPPYSLIGQLHRREVQEDLKLNDSQKQQVEAIVRSTSEKNVALFRNTFRGSPAGNSSGDRTAIRDQMTKDLAALADEAGVAVTAILTPMQKQRLEQLILQARGLRALLLPEVAKKLNLTSEQSSRISELVTEEAGQTRVPGGRASRSFQPRDWNKRSLAVLSAEQQETWKQMLGRALPYTPPVRRTSLPGTRSPESTARYWFGRFDDDKDGQLSAVEWLRSRNIRADFTNDGLDLSQPMNRDDFVNHYLRIRHPELHSDKSER